MYSFLVQVCTFDGQTEFHYGRVYTCDTPVPTVSDINRWKNKFKSQSDKALSNLDILSFQRLWCEELDGNKNKHAETERIEDAR